MDNEEENKLDEDEFVVLIISNDDENNFLDLGEECPNFNLEVIKEEPIDPSVNDINLDEILEEADQEEEYILSDKPNYFEELEYIEDDQDIKNDNITKTKDEHKPNTTKSNSGVVVKNIHRFQPKCLPAEYHHSFVEELRNTYPELRQDESKLISKLFDVMQNCKPEEPPEDFLADEETLECAVCSSKSKSISAAKRHFQQKHGPRYLICYACGQDFRCSTNLGKHEKRCKAQDAPIVLKARALSVGRKGFNRPFLNPQSRAGKVRGKHRYHYYPSFNCDECPAVFKTKVSFLAHRNLHKGIRPYKCNECFMAYTNRPALQRHMKTHNPKADFVCDVCAAVFHFKSAITSHMNTHLPQKKYPCTFPGCERRFAQRTTMKVHASVEHFNMPLPHACDMCDKRFDRASRLKVHMREVHGMLLMTRQMFLRTLPKMSDFSVQQGAEMSVTPDVIESGPDSNFEQTTTNKVPSDQT